VRHATPADLDRLEPLLEQLRAIDGLKERKRGNFTRRSQAFLHFHEHDGEMIADVRLNETFDRYTVTTAAQQLRLLRVIRRAVR
jgi:hypothetical protein